jgi:hypothetical protein
MMTIEDIADTPGISADSFSEPADRCGIQAIRPGQSVLVFAFALFDDGYFPFWFCIFKQYVAMQLR